MSELLTPEERSALNEPFSAPERDEWAVTQAVFADVDQLDSERIASLTGPLRRWLDHVAQELAGLLRCTCTPRLPAYQLVPRGLLPAPEEEPFWAAIEGFPGSDLLVSFPRSFAATIAERLFGAPFELREDRALTPAEIALIRDLIQRWLERCPEPWQDHRVRLLPPVDEEEVTPESPDRAWLRFDSDLLCGPVMSSIAVSLAPFTARVLLGETTSAAGQAPSPAMLRARLGDVPIELRAVLGQATFS